MNQVNEYPDSSEEGSHRLSRCSQAGHQDTGLPMGFLFTRIFEPPWYSASEDGGSV